MNGIAFNKCEMKNSNELGRYMIACEAIMAGELLLKERTTIIGPHWNTGICCMNCYNESEIMCKNCKRIPLCWDCLDKHDSAECHFFENSNVPKNFIIDNINVVTPLRLLLFLVKCDAVEDENFQRILSMESHCTKRRDTAIWKQNLETVLGPMRTVGLYEKFHFKNNIQVVNDDFLQKICGILDVNSFEVRTPNIEESCVRGLYPNAALLTHCCISNTFITMSTDKELIIHASIDIAAGEMVYNNYTSVLSCRTERQENLMNGKYFQCQCMRCSDPTDLGTHFNSIHCEQCNIGMVICQDKDWCCSNCKQTMNHSDVQQLLNTAQTESHIIQRNVEQMETFLLKYKKLFSDNHYILIDMKQRLATVIRKKYEFDAKTVSNELLQRKIQLCQDIYAILNVFQPGISRLKSIVLYEQFIPLWALRKRWYDDKSIDAEEYLIKLNEAEDIAKEAIQMLVYEPTSTPEGILARKAMSELKLLRDEKHKIQKMINKLTESLRNL